MLFRPYWSNVTDNFLKQRISLAIHVANAACVLGTIIFITNIEQLQDLTKTIYVSLHYNTILINQLNSIKHVYLNRYLRIRLVTVLNICAHSMENDYQIKCTGKTKTATSSLEIANLMNDYFCSVFLPRWNYALYAHDNPSIP